MKSESECSLSNFETILYKNAEAVVALLDRLLSATPRNGEVTRPAQLLEAMRHAVFNGGKRLRPFLVIESAALFDAIPEPVLHIAAALECVHCYSLIHDDLPSMDDDDIRRGKPTVHKMFDEATAILAGDALLTIAFDILADNANGLSAPIRAGLVLLLARACGLGGMVGGQMLDLAAQKVQYDEKGIITLQTMKTGALLRFACKAGVVAANATMEDQERLAEFGSLVGLAFQLVDDLLDIKKDTGGLGKKTVKDAIAGKATLVTLHDINWIHRQLDRLIEQANDILQPYGKKADILRHVTLFISHRTHSIERYGETM
ncbi:MAG: farnesyl diphosphate synthase [Candidatus Tokpelaia sp. JSC085]|nr:MAG: farnesyl diphosphate synthase [Candidatus Tokpelaia sp. JSC085]